MSRRRKRNGVFRSKRAVKARIDAIRMQSAAGRGSLRGRNVAEGKVYLQIFHRLSIRFRVGVDKVVQRIALPNGGQADVAVVREQDTVGIRRRRRIAFPFPRAAPTTRGSCDEKFERASYHGFPYEHNPDF